MFLLGFRRKLTALALCKSIESAIQWFQIHHRITIAAIQNPAVYLSGAFFLPWFPDYMEIYENLCEACGKSSFSLNTVYIWFAHFSYGKSDILDKPSYRKPVEVTDDYNVERNKGTFG